MSDQTQVSEIQIYGGTSLRGIILTASDPDGSNAFTLNTHGSATGPKLSWTIGANQFIAKIDLIVSQNQVTWIRFSQQNGLFFQSAPLTDSTAVQTLNFSQQVPFVGLKSYSDLNGIYGLAALSYSCVGKNPLPPVLPYSQIPKSIDGSVISTTTATNTTSNAISQLSKVESTNSTEIITFPSNSTANNTLTPNTTVPVIVPIPEPVTPVTPEPT